MSPEHIQDINSCGTRVLKAMRAYRDDLAAEFRIASCVWQEAKLTGNTEALEASTQAMRETYRELSEVDVAIQRWA